MKNLWNTKKCVRQWQEKQIQTAILRNIRNNRTRDSCQSTPRYWYVYIPSPWRFLAVSERSHHLQIKRKDLMKTSGKEHTGPRNSHRASYKGKNSIIWAINDMSCTVKVPMINYGENTLFFFIPNSHYGADSILPVSWGSFLLCSASPPAETFLWQQLLTHAK